MARFDLDATLAQIRDADKRARVREQADFDQTLAAARDGDVDSMYFVAHDLDGDEDFDAAIAWYERAHKGGHELAAHNLGCIFDKRGDYAQARAWYERAVQSGDASAMCNLGYLYDHGKGVDACADTARDLYERGVDGDDAQCAVNLACLLEAHEPKSAYRVAELRRFAAQDGHVGAAYTYAEMLAAGTGCERDLEAAKHWMRVAACAGVPEARAWLAERDPSYITRWDWEPGQSLGPIRFAERIESVVSALPALALEAQEDEDPSEPDCSYQSPYYPIQVLCEEHRVTSVGVAVGETLDVRWEGKALHGIGVEEALRTLAPLLERAGDVRVTPEDPAYWDCQIESPQLGLELEVIALHVAGLSCILPIDHPLWD